MDGDTLDEIAIMVSLALFLLLSAVCSIVFNKIKLPPLIGYLMAGIIVSNFFSIDEVGESVVEILSQMGLIMLMFCIGMEINLKKIRKQGAFAIEVALVQLPLMVLGGVIAGTLMGMDMVQSICLGGIISGSSTAVVLAVLKSQNRLDKDHIEMLVLITIMEDIGQVIILSMITPMLAGTELDTNGLIAMVISIIAFMVISILVGLRFMPRIVNWVSDNVSMEVLVIFCIGLAFGMALVADYAGLSVAIGAFLMGMMIASSRKNKDILRDIEPMKNVFMTMFFISVGMEIKLPTLWENIGLIIGLYILYLVLKSSTVFLGYWIGNEKPRTGFLSAIGLVAMGEFAFIIAKEALDHGVLDEAFYTSVIGAALLSMIMLPLLTRSSEAVWDNAVSVCPKRLMSYFTRINAARDSLYSNISNSSRRTRKEFSRLMTLNYVCLLLAAAVEVLFVLINPAIPEWLSEYLGGSVLTWSIMFLLMNLFLLYIPIFTIVTNLRAARRIGSKDPDAVPVHASGTAPGVADMFLMSDTTMLSLMISILILIVVPNNIGMWEHFAVLFLALVILFFYNRRNLARRMEKRSYEEDDSQYEVDLDTFRKDVHRKHVALYGEKERIGPAKEKDDKE